MYCTKCGQKLDGAKSSSSNALLKVNSVLLLIIAPINLLFGIICAYHSGSSWAYARGLVLFYQTMSVFAIVSFILFLVAGSLALAFAHKLKKTILVFSIITLLVVFAFFGLSLFPIHIAVWVLPLIALPSTILYFVGALQNNVDDAKS